MEAIIGLGLVALLISYLPTIYAAHHDRGEGHPHAHTHFSNGSVAGTLPRAVFRKNELNWEPVHICLAWRLLFSQGWGFQGPSDRRGRDTTFRARRRIFSTSLALPDPANRRRRRASRCRLRLLTDRRRRSGDFIALLRFTERS